MVIKSCDHFRNKDNTCTQTPQQVPIQFNHQHLQSISPLQLFALNKKFMSLSHIDENLILNIFSILHSYTENLLLINVCFYVLVVYIVSSITEVNFEDMNCLLHSQVKGTKDSYQEWLRMPLYYVTSIEIKIFYKQVIKTCKSYSKETWDWSQIDM